MVTTPFAAASSWLGEYDRDHDAAIAPDERINVSPDAKKPSEGFQKDALKFFAAVAGPNNDAFPVTGVMLVKWISQFDKDNDGVLSRPEWDSYVDTINSLVTYRSVSLG